jgi:hypothetical protein
MTKTKMYRYLGRNGIITSPVLLDKVEPIVMYELIAAEGKVLTNGEKSLKSTLVFEDEMKDWTEIDDPNLE